MAPTRNVLRLGNPPKGKFSRLANPMQMTRYALAGQIIRTVGLSASVFVGVERWGVRETRSV